MLDPACVRRGRVSMQRPPGLLQQLSSSKAAAGEVFVSEQDVEYSLGEAAN